MKDQTKLIRKIQPMPSYVEKALDSQHLMDAYFERPAYQRNDYLGWIDRAKRQETKDKRINQMLEELRQGGVYMKMDHPSSRKS